MDAGEFLAFNQEGEWKKGAAQQERKKKFRVLIGGCKSLSERKGWRMSKKNQIFLAILLILSAAGFIANMILSPVPRWLKAYNLLVVLAWGMLIFRTGKEKGRYW
ncbi:hypothetical protein ABER60_12300 [Heyndrickxia coagulans]|uniref:hypothetical protein n=2 Tax=Heyndrickxia TaxID=2837504 RepID=UPI001F2F9D15|nr:hypothetical protein [Heyndrickxia coagulans]MED4942694.1 hypothetical protein [Heyndrickxia coagulans]MED4962914.1 hypothetical protein [Heyndrickxia coagulans]